MSDRAPVQATIAACPEDQREAAFAVLADYLEDDYGIYSGPEPPLRVGRFETYVAEELSLGTAGEIANRLIAAAPGATFVVHDDPFGEWLGTIIMYTPDLGRFDGDCDASGNVVMTAEQIMAVVNADPDGPLSLSDRLEAALGIPWENAIKATEEVPA